jgi:hypothetical protein
MTDAPPPPAPEAGPGIEVRAVAVGEVRPFRLAYLRPGQGEAGVTYKTDDEPSAAHLGAYLGERLVGVVSHHLENRVAGVAPYGHPGVRARGLAIEPDAPLPAVADRLLATVLEAARALQAGEVWANVRLVQDPLYAAAGLAAVSSEFDIPGLGVHRVMARRL